MAWNAGTFSRTHDWTQDQANGIKIRADRHDQEDDNLATGINTCLTKDGQNSPSADLPMATYKHTGVGNATARTHYAAAGQVQDQSFTWCGTAGGTNNALTLSPTPAITAYAAGQRFVFFSGSSASDSTVTVSVSGLATKAIQSDGAALSASVYIEADKWYEILYDGTAFQLNKISLPTLSTELVNYTADWVDVASATTTDIGAAASLKVRITGTTTITGLGTVASGTMRKIRFAGALTLTHNGTSLILPGDANITTAADDTAEAISLGSGNWIVTNYQKASGAPAVLPAVYQAQPSDPTGTTNTSGVMMGLAGAITPSSTGRIMFMISGTVETTVSTSGCRYQIRYGTGTAPSNGASLTGTAIGNEQVITIFATSPSDSPPFSLQAIVTGLTPSTAYWFDLSLGAVTSGTAAAKEISMSAFEI